MDYKSKYTGYQVEELLDKAGTSLQSSDISTVATTGSYDDLSNKPIIPDISSKQDILVSGANIKTINGESILGSGDITIEDDNYVKYVTQTLTDEQKTQARTNIGAISKTDLNDIDLSAYETKVDSQNKLQQSKQYTDEQIINVQALVNRLITDTELKFFCIEPVTIIINGNSTVYDTNTLVDLFLNTDDTFEVVPTSNTSIASLYAWPGALETYYEWLEGVNLFDGILFNMNNEDLYTKWSQGNQGLYHVQFAQYKNCIFWSDLSYVSDVSKRTNYTMYNSSELPLCYSTIPDNTFKAFYFAYNVTCDPNWSNPAYKESFSKATWATQVFSYYGLHSIGLFDMDSSRFNIVLPKDCRGLMYYAPNILNAGVFDATNTTNFGAKSGSWRDAFAHCYQLTNLYIKNLKVNLNISWSPVNQQSLNFILSKSANTNKITIYLSPHTYYGLTDANKTLATEKNIVLSLIDTNTSEDVRLHTLQMTGDGNSFLANDGTYKNLNEYVTNDSLETKINEAIDSIVDNAPETLDTLGELATAFKDNSDVVGVLNSAIVNKSDIGHNHNGIYYTKAEVDELLSKYVSKDVVSQMIEQALDNYFNSNPETPDTPDVPDTPEDPTPEYPMESIGSISDDNSIVIDETQLENGTYILRYIDSNNNIIDNFNDITSFEINN